MSAQVQPDLFGDYDRDIEQQAAREAAAAERTALWRQPGTCPACGTTEPNGYVLEINHGISPEGATARYYASGQCTAQYLVSNHIRFAVRRGDDAQLERDIARGRELRLDVDAIVAEARA